MERLLDPRTLAAVIAATPELPSQKDLARDIVKVLRCITADVDPDGSPEWIHSDLVQNITECLEGDNTASAVGGILRQLGLTGQRTRDGYRYFWTIEQLNILSQALLPDYAPINTPAPEPDCLPCPEPVEGQWNLEALEGAVQ